MAEPIIMPRQGLSVESCILTEWKKDVGDEIKKGDVVFTFETDKSTFEREAETEGILLARFFEAGEEVEVLTNVGVVGREGEDVSDFRPDEQQEEPAAKKEETEADDTAEKKEHPAQKKPAPKEKPAEKRVTDSGPEISEQLEETSGQPEAQAEEIFISPRAQRRAEKLQVDYKMARPTGPENRIITRDIEQLAEEGPVFTPAAKEMYEDRDIQLSPGQIKGTGPGGKVTTSDLEHFISASPAVEQQPERTEKIPSELEYEDLELTNIRQNIADTMYRSLQESAQLTLDSSFDASEILAYRNKVKEGAEELGLEDISLNSLILFTVARTLDNFDRLNAHFVDDKIRQFKNVHLGMAVDTERGLMAPTIFRANLKTLSQINREAKKRSEECRSGSISPDYLKNASFTVTNLGALGIESFTPILNPPQVGILGINTIEHKIKKEGSNEPETYPAMGLSLTFDHRALDGAPAARFLQQLSRNLENFSLLLAR